MSPKKLEQEPDGPEGTDGPDDTQYTEEQQDLFDESEDEPDILEDDDDYFGEFIDEDYETFLDEVDSLKEDE